MDPNLDARLKAIETKLDEQAKLLGRLDRARRVGTYVRYAYWIALILLTIASVYFVMPYVNQLGAAYGLTGGDSTAKDSGANTLLKQLEQYQKANQ